MKEVSESWRMEAGEPEFLVPTQWPLIGINSGLPLRNAVLPKAQVRFFKYALADPPRFESIRGF